MQLPVMVMVLSTERLESAVTQQALFSPRKNYNEFTVILQVAILFNECAEEYDLNLLFTKQIYDLYDRSRSTNKTNS